MLFVDKTHTIPPHNIYSRLVGYSNEKQLYFIPVFIYTCIKVKLTEGEKEMTSPKPNRTISADFFGDCKIIT